MGKQDVGTPPGNEVLRCPPRIDCEAIIEGCPRCGKPLNVQEPDVKPEICNLYVVTGVGAKAYRRPLVSVCENEVIFSCPHCNYWESIWLI